MKRYEKMSLSTSAKQQMLLKLSEIGEVAFESRRQEMIPAIPKIDELETTLRYLLLWSMINQRTEAKIAGQVAFSLYEKFGEDLFFRPTKVLRNFKGVTKVFQELKYPVRFAYLTRNAIATLLVGSFLSFMIKLNGQQENLEPKAREGPRKFADFLRRETLLSALGEKATRMYVSFIGHPKIDLTEINYDKRKLFVFVDGTVGKVFARTGLIEKVRSYRGHQVYATKMRLTIDKLMDDLKIEDPMMVDGGTYALGQFCCVDTNPSCQKCNRTGACIIAKVCNGKCPLFELGCLKRVQWMAYRT